MKYFDIAVDIEIVQELLDLSVADLAKNISVAEKKAYGKRTAEWLLNANSR